MNTLTAPLIPQEIYLLERYSSLEYFGAMRDHFAAMLKTAQDALDEFMKWVPPDYRSLHTSQQPDLVWGERIIPNLQWVLDGLNKAYIRIANGALDALGMGSNVSSAFSAINRDYSWDWMPALHFDKADAENSEAWERAVNISTTAYGDWTKGALTTRYKESDRGPLHPPATWPQYRLKPETRVKTGDLVPQNGIYLPDDDRGAAQLLIKGYEACALLLPLDPEKGIPQPREERSVATTWTLVERVADGEGTVTGPAHDHDSALMRLRCEAGASCPREGWWFTPASAARRYFKQGEVMPELKSDYGLTIWQWDVQQDDA